MRRRPGRYAKRLIVVAALIAAIIGLGYLWRSNSSLASFVADGGGDGELGPKDGGRFRGGNGGAFSLANSGDLITTLAIGVSVMVLVVLVDKVRRRRRPIRPDSPRGLDAGVRGPE